MYGGTGPPGARRPRGRVPRWSGSGG
jgi:hypothetical protein